jgi:HSP20 family protein
VKPLSGATPAAETVTGAASCPTTPASCPTTLLSDDDVDEAIEAVEQLLRAVTGRELSPCGEATRSPIPPEQDAGQHVEGQIERLLALLPGPSRPRSSWAPSISLYELPEELLVTFDLPGVSRAGVEVSMDRGFLEVKGERARRHRRRASVAWNEARVGAFCRRVPLPAGCSSDGMRAEMTDGVLEVRIPVQAESGARRVAVQDGAERGGAAL